MSEKLNDDLKKYVRTQQTFGLFGTAFSGTGNPYQDKKDNAGSRNKGAQFTTNKKPIAGKLLRLYEGEKNVSLYEIERKLAVEEKKKQLTSEGFRPPSRAKKDLIKPLFGPHVKNMPEGVHREKGTKSDVQPEPRQFMTSPSKKGWGNTPGITFGPPAPKDDPKMQMKGKEYAYQGGSYDEAAAAEKAERLKHHAQLAGRPPMNPVGRSIDYFDNANVTVVACSSIFKEDKTPTEPLFRSPPKEERPQTAPFYPAKGPQSGPGRFPEWISDPDSHRAELRKKELEAAKTPAVPFVPPSQPKSMPVKSVLFHAPGR